MEEHVHAELEELPEDADGHGEAEGHQRQKDGGEIEGEALVVVEEHHHGKAHGGGQEAVEGVEHGVPVGDDHVKGVDLAQNLRRVDEAEDGDLQGGGQLNVELHLNPAGHIEQQVSQGTVKRALIAAVYELADENDDDQKPQGVEHDKGAHVLPQLLFHGLAEVFLLPPPCAFLVLLAELGHGDLLFVLPAPRAGKRRRVLDGLLMIA